MTREPVHTLILGAGPAGLAAGCTLARAGKNPLILERDKSVGGLMRSIKRGDFILDIGRKELYNRIAKVDEFWSDLLGSDYRLYPHRGGLLFKGHILDLSPAYRGFRRGMPWSMFLAACADFAVSRAKGSGKTPRTLEEYFYHTRGRRLTQIVSQGFQEKITGRKYSEIVLPPNLDRGEDSGLFKTVRAALTRTFSKAEPNTYKGIWRHPAKGTGQICETLERCILQNGGRIICESKVLDIDASGDRVRSVTVEFNGETHAYEPEHVISSIPLDALIQLVLKRQFDPGGPKDKGSPFRKKTVVLVYLFLNEEPRFPHAWLNVTCPNTRIGRITNYAGLNGDMVPAGKTALCCEFYCYDDDPLLKMENSGFADHAVNECAKYSLIDQSKVFDHLVIRLPGADASQNRHNWMSNVRVGLLNEIKPFKNLYYTNRTDLDIATLAGIESAEAVLSGDRSTFDRHIDPTQIGIRSEKKAFEFKNPLANQLTDLSKQS